MKKQTFKAIVIGTLVWVSLLTVRAYDVWNPIQFVKQLFATPNGELDQSKATIKINGTNGRIDAKSIYANNQKVLTEWTIPRCSKGYTLTSYDGRTLTCVKWYTTSSPVNGKCSTSIYKCSVGSVLSKTSDSNYYRWKCSWKDGWKTVSCNKKKSSYVDKCTSSTLWKKNKYWKTCTKVSAISQCKDYAMKTYWNKKGTIWKPYFKSYSYNWRYIYNLVYKNWWHESLIVYCTNSSKSWIWINSWKIMPYYTLYYYWDDIGSFKKIKTFKDSYMFK